MGMTLQDAVRQRLWDAELKGELIRDEYQLPPYLGRDEDDHLVYPGVDYLKATQKWCDGVYDSSTGEMAEDDDIKNIRRAINYLQGIHWPESRPSYRPSPVINRIAKFFWDNAANLTDVKLNMDVRTENPNHKDLAENLTKVAQANYRAQDGLLSLIFTVMHATLAMGYTKVGFDWAKDDVVYLPLGTDSVFPILGCPTDFQQSAGVVYRVWKPLSWFYDTFPALAHKVKAEGGNLENYVSNKPWGVDSYTWNSIAPGLRDYLYAEARDTVGDAAWGRTRLPMALYTEFWFHDPQINTSNRALTMGYGNSSYTVKPGERVYPYGRMIATAHQHRRVILNDVPNWHWHGCFPFAPLRLSPVPWSWTGMNELRDLIPIQDNINKVLADGLSLLNQATNKIMVTKEGSMSAATWNNYFPGMPAAKIKLLNRMEGIEQQVKWIGPDVAALAAVPVLYNLLKMAFDEQSGQLDVNRLASKKQIPSSESIEEMREAQQGRYRIKGIFLESYYNALGRLALSDIMQFYTRKKIISTLGPDGLSWEYFDYDPDSVVPHDVRTGPYERGRSFVRQFTMMMAAGAALPAQRRQMVSIAVGLSKMNKMSIETLYRTLQAAGAALPDGDTELEL